MKKSLLGVSVIALTVGFVGSASAEGMMGAIQGSIMPKVDTPDIKMPDVEKPDVDSAINKFKEKLGMNKEETTEENSEDAQEGQDEATEENSEDEGSEEATEENSAEGEKEEGDNDGDADDMPKKKSIWDYFKK